MCFVFELQTLSVYYTTQTVCRIFVTVGFECCTAATVLFSLASKTWLGNCRSGQAMERINAPSSTHLSLQTCMTVSKTDECIISSTVLQNNQIFLCFLKCSQLLHRLFKFKHKLMLTGTGSTRSRKKNTTRVIYWSSGGHRRLWEKKVERLFAGWLRCWMPLFRTGTACPF